MGYYAAGDPGLFDFLGSAASWLGGAVSSVGKSLGFSGPAQVMQRMAETGNPLASFTSVAKERGWGSVAMDVARGVGMAATGGLLGAGAASAASIGAGLFSATEPPAGGPAYEDLLTQTIMPFNDFVGGSGYGTDYAYDDPDIDYSGSDYGDADPELSPVTAPGTTAILAPYLAAGQTTTQAIGSVIRRVRKF